MSYLDLVIEEDDVQIVTDKIILTNDQAIQLAIQGFTQIDSNNWYKRKRYDSRLQAELFLKPGELIAESNSAVFILTRNKNASPVTVPMLNNKGLFY